MRREIFVELRSVDTTESGKITGVAAVYNSLSEPLYGFREKLAPGCFTKSLRENKSIKCLFNHDSSSVLGSTANGTLELSDTADGLRFVATPPDTQYAKDAITVIKRGDVSGCSFMFDVLQDQWAMDDDETRIRTVTEAKIYEVSPCTFPAYQATSVDAREMLAEIRSSFERRNMDKINRDEINVLIAQIQDLINADQDDEAEETDEGETTETEPDDHSETPPGPHQQDSVDLSLKEAADWLITHA
jgi:Escherichia/Staphylococcus phage prohead protease